LICLCSCWYGYWLDQTSAQLSLWWIR